MKKSDRVSFFRACQRAIQEKRAKRRAKNVQFDISYEDSKYLRNIEAKGKKKSYIRLGAKNIKAKKVAVAIISLILVLAVAGGITVHTILKKFSKNADIDHSDLGIEENVDYGDPGVKNIALFGVDTREENSFDGRSDTIMIASVNKNAHTVRLVSIMRDSYVPIDGHKSQKITHAYMYGGAQLAIKTINKNFGLNITDYATINFFKLASMIDSIGGIDLDITEKERDYLNNHSMMTPEEAQYFTEPLSAGHIHLTGGQASWYARIRYLDGDDHRTARQRKVIEACLAKLKNIKPKDYVSTVNAMMKFCETSLTPREILQLAPMVAYNDIKIETFNVPSENIHPIGGVYDGAWVWRYDLKKAAKEINAFLYGKLPDYSGGNQNDSDSDYDSGSNSKKEASKSTEKKSSSEKKVSEKSKNNNVNKSDNTKENKETVKQTEKQTEKPTEKFSLKQTTKPSSTKAAEENN